MRILHTVHLYPPCTGGSEEVVRQLSERLAARGHEVTVATSYDPRRTFDRLNGVTVRQFRIAGNAATGITGEAEAYRRFLQEGKFDVMLNYAAQSWATDLVLPLLDRLGGRKVLVPCGYPALADPRFAAYFAGLPDALRRYDALVYMSPSTRDTLFGRQHGLADREVQIPNGAAAEEFAAPPAGFKAAHGLAGKRLLVCVANHTGIKGHDTVIRAFRRMRRRDAVLAVIGERLPGGRPWSGCWWGCRARAAVTPGLRLYRGLSRPEVVGALAEADLFLFASKVECAPLVLYESFAARTPFVSTAVGNIADHAGEIRLVTGAADMAAAANALLDDEPARTALAERAHGLWRERHTWTAITDRYEALYRGERT